MPRFLLNGPQLLAILLCFASAAAAIAGSFRLPDEAVQCREASAIFVGKAIAQRSTRNPKGAIETETVFAVQHTIKGVFAEEVILVSLGGVDENDVEWISAAPQFHSGLRYLIFATVDDTGQLRACHGSASVRRMKEQRPFEEELRLRKLSKFASARDDNAADARRLIRNGAMVPNLSPSDSNRNPKEFIQEFKAVTASGLTEYSIPSGSPYLPVRFIAGDRGKPIPYLVDDEILPDGVSRQEALKAVRDAFDAWGRVTSLTFQFEETTYFGKSARDLDFRDGKIRIQLHDKYNTISSISTLGFGGVRANNGGYKNGGSAGRVNGLEYHEIREAYVIVNHRAPQFDSLVTLTEVISHEIGHSLGLAHSSESSNETDASKKEALMYFQTHKDQRGADLRAWDIEKIGKSYPADDTPPWMAKRQTLDATTHPTGWQISNPVVNELHIAAGDLQTPRDNLDFTIISQSLSGGSFTVDGPILRYAPSKPFSDTERLDPQGTSYFDRAVIRAIDGPNASPFVDARIISLNRDTEPLNSPDGIPNWWVSQHFNGTNTFEGPNADPDDDGCDNLCEYLQRTDPLDPNSVVKIQFSPSSRAIFETTSILDIAATASVAPERTFTVPISFSGTAKKGEDFQQLDTRLLFTPDSQAATFLLQLLDDNTYESTESLLLTLQQSPYAASGAYPTFELTITDDEVPSIGNPPSVYIHSISFADEGNTLVIQWSGTEGTKFCP